MQVLDQSSPLWRMPLVCPLDGLPLQESSGSLRCANNHSFDCAASGYVNLLPVQFKASRDPGDSKSMVSSRRRVLHSGLFDPLAAEFSARVVGLSRELPVPPTLLVDACCGEGFFTAHTAKCMRAQLPSAVNTLFLGVDISKWAILAAAKAHKEIGWVVASNKRLPIKEGAASIMTCCFGFEAWQAWAQLQTRGQLVLMVDAGPNHLLELRRIIYPSIHLKEAASHPMAAASGYTQIAEKTVTYRKQVSDKNLILALLEMTPHGHKITPAGREAASEITQWELTFETILRTYVRV